MIILKAYTFLKTIFLIGFISLTISACSSDVNNLEEVIGYQIVENKITYNGNPVQLIGANTLQSFGVGSQDLVSWNLDIAREFVGNIKENPVSGAPILDANNQWLHSLEAIVAENRANNLITILCSFGWDGTTENLFTGKKPTETFFYSDFKNQLELWAETFKDQNDVWIEVWNEPYRLDRADGYTDAIWLSDMTELYQLVRSKTSSIILIPCAEQGQDESVLINFGSTFLSGKANVLFDIHAYEKWLLESEDNMYQRLTALTNKKLPIFFGEIAPVNSGVLMNPNPLLELLSDSGISLTAWLWKYDEDDQDALLTKDGTPNNVNNNNWGSSYKSLAIRERSPKNANENKIKNQ
jgi:mannan endo-1,4-beta-mannosidase